MLCAVAVSSDDAAHADRSTAVVTKTYISAGSQVRYQVTKAASPARVLPRQALAGLDRVLGQRADMGEPDSAADSEAPAAKKSEPAKSGPVATWRTQGLLTGLQAQAPLAAAFGNLGKCNCKTKIADTSKQRISALYATRRFKVGAELSRMKVLRFRARFRDGLVAHLNGREVARRNVDRNAKPTDYARRLRGPEWETFHIPVTPGLLKRGENVLAVEVRPSSWRLAPTLDLELSASSAGRIIRGPIVQRVTASSAVIAFDTEMPSTASVDVGTKPGVFERTLRSSNGALAQHHVVAVPNLPLGKPVYYRVKAGNETTGTYRFHPAPAAGEPIRFVVYGDMRGGHTVHSKLVKAMMKDAPDFIVVTGDLVMRGSDEGDWQRFFQVTEELLPRVPYYPVAGNHDIGLSGDERRRLNEIFVLWPGPKKRPAWGHWYSFDVADLHFVMLDSNAYQHAEQRAWLQKDLRAAKKRGARVIFAAAHDGPYSRGPHRGNRYAARRYAPLLAKYKTTLMFSGHDHLYQRGKVDGLGYIVSGGGGAPLYRVSCGVKGRRKCRVNDGMLKVAREYHYVLVEVFKRTVRMCPKRPDRSLIEPCVTYKIPRRRRAKKRR